MMGGQTLILRGDFRLILPVVKRGTKTDNINSCMKISVMWTNIRLTKNMRVFLSNNQDTATFQNHLLDIGNGMTYGYYYERKYNGKLKLTHHDNL